MFIKTRNYNHTHEFMRDLALYSKGN